MLPIGSSAIKPSMTTIKISSTLSPIITSPNVLFKPLFWQAPNQNVSNAMIQLLSSIFTKKLASPVQTEPNITPLLTNVKNLRHPNQPVNVFRITSGAILKTNASVLRHSQSIWDVSALNVWSHSFGTLLKEPVS